MLYTHVRLLRANGLAASVLHEKYRFRTKWLDMEVPRVYRDRASFRTRPDDVLVIPEVMAAQPDIVSLEGRRIVFVQASSYIAPALRDARDYRELGYEGAIAVMPHVQEIVERHYGVAAPVIPPCVAPYFYIDREALHLQSRKRQVVLHPKPWCRDYPTVRKTLLDRLPAMGWHVLELENKTHREVAQVLRESAFFLSVNCQESFNAMVPEAMASGCIPICYESFGGHDYLQDRKNAYVFPTHHTYPLLNTTLGLIENYDRLQGQLRKIRRGGFKTAAAYAEPHTERALIRYFKRMLRTSPAAAVA